MKTWKIFTSVCLCQFLWMPSFCDDECPYQECECKFSTIFCDGKGLHDIPVLVNRNPSTTELNLDDNQITTIPLGSLPPNLTQLSIQDNPLTSIDDDAFSSSALTLTTLIFSKPLFSRIPNALLHLQNLQELTVKEAGILDWNVDVMKQIGQSLKNINLESVNFTFPPTWLQYLSRLTTLSIVGTSLSSLPDNALDTMADTLYSVTFTNNGLTEVPKALSNLTSLKMLDLSYNKIASTKWLPTSTHAMIITLSENRIHNSSELSNSLRQYGKFLAVINIESNQLTSIPDLSFFTGMRSISFKDNKITDYTSGALPTNCLALDLENNLLTSIPVGLPGLEILEAIVLKSNIISHIQGADFPPRVETVVLANNRLTALNDDSFPEDSLIEILNLSYNPISIISHDVFKNLDLLEQLILQGTRLTRLPLALNYLDDLDILDLTDTSGLVCTCQEKDLAAWVLYTEGLTVLGNCGNIGVFDFFSLLSPGCPQ